MTEIYRVHEGSTPLLISVPHDGRELPDDVAVRMTEVGKDIPDTDWDVARLYDFAKDLGASFVIANYSRYVVDLNRPPDNAALYAGQIATGICPSQSFSGEDLYRDGASVAAEEQEERVRTYWQPYHDHIGATLTRLRQQHGYALLWDAHSIPSSVPRLFDGELPVLNLGTHDGQSCAANIAGKVADLADRSDYESVVNGRFKGGYITRHYGAPTRDIHAIQLEIAQRAYMDESSRTFDDSRAKNLRATLRSMLETFLRFS